jgi:acetyltransferase-like isoleucine patch superfamily enzyme
MAGGTLLANGILRWMGCKIGKRTIFSLPLQAFDWNAVSFGDDCMVVGLLQYHTLENMRLKVKRTDIKDGCVINHGATVMGGTSVCPETTIMPLSLVLKEMQLPSGIYAGSPVEPLDTRSLLPQSDIESRAGSAGSGIRVNEPNDEQ